MTHTQPLKYFFGVAVASIILASTGGPVQASVVQIFGVNNARVDAYVTVGFDGLGSGAADSFLSAAPPVTTDPLAGFNFPTTTPPASIPPAFSTVGKDKAEATCTSIFNYGAPVGPEANDQVEFHVAGTVSAVDARNFAGNPASAYATAHGSVRFYLDAAYGGVAPGTLVGYLSFPALRNLLPSELSLVLKVTQESSLPISPIVLTMHPGDPNAVAPLYADAAYTIALDYTAVAPFGTDPLFSLDYAAGVNAPEPATLSLLTAGMGGLLLRRKKK